VSLVTDAEARLVRRYEQDLGISLQRIRVGNGEIQYVDAPSAR